MGVVVFVASSASGELDWLFSVGEVSDEVMVEELAAVVAIKAEEGERECFFDVFDLFENPSFTFAPYRALFGPSGGDIDEVDGIGVHSLQGLAAMGDGIGFEKTGP